MIDIVERLNRMPYEKFRYTLEALPAHLAQADQVIHALLEQIQQWKAGPWLLPLRHQSSLALEDHYWAP